MSTALESPSSAPATSSPAPASAPAAAPSQSSSSPAAQGAPKQSAAPSQSNNAVESPTEKAPRQGKRSRDNDPLFQRAKELAQKARDNPDGAPEAAPATPAQASDGQPQPSAQDRAKAALSTNAGTAPTPTAPPQQSAPPDPQAELTTLRRSNSHLGRQMSQFQQELQTLRQEREQRATEAKTAALKPYHAKHPEYQANMARVARADGFDKAWKALPPEVQTSQLRAQMAHSMGVTNEDMALRSQQADHAEQVKQEMAADPDGYIERRAEEVAERKFQQLFERKTQEQQITQEIQRDLEDPLVQRYRQERPEEFQKAVNDLGGRTDYAAHMVKLHSANTELIGVLQEKDRIIADLEAKSGMSAEQQRLLKGRVTHTREPATQLVIDPLKAARDWAKANGVPPSMSHPKFRDKLDELMRIHKKPSNA